MTVYAVTLTGGALLGRSSNTVLPFSLYDEACSLWFGRAEETVAREPEKKVWHGRGRQESTLSPKAF